MLQELTDIINSVNSEYVVHYEERNMYNIDADELGRDGKFCYIEEFATGSIDNSRSLIDSANVQLYFYQFIEMQDTALAREAIRKEIKQDIVYPFIRAMKINRQNQLKNYNWEYPPSWFDANEVGVLLTFNFKEYQCD